MPSCPAAFRDSSPAIRSARLFHTHGAAIDSSARKSHSAGMRLLLCLIASLALLGFTLTANAAVRAGDADGDQQLDLADVGATIRELFDGDGNGVDQVAMGDYRGAAGADANDDALVTAADVAFLPALLVAPYWESSAPLRSPRQELGVAELDGRIYTVGGLDTAAFAVATVERFDPDSGTWEAVASLPTRLHHVPVAATGGKLYSLGGLGPFGFAASSLVFAYDPQLDQWSARAPLPLARGAGAAAVIDGKIYVAGGLRAGSSVADFAVYDPQADQWTTLAPMPTARDHLGAAAIDGIFYAVSGRVSALLDAVEAYDPAVGTWHTVAPIPTARGGLAVTALRGRLFAIGGEGNPADRFGIFPQTEAYDPSTDRWESLPDMLTPRHGIGAAALRGRIYVPGGATIQGFAASAAHDILLP